MKKITYLVLGLLIVSFVFCGCSGSSEVKVFGKQDRDITVSSGKRFMIQLEENPSTGYAWSFVISDKGVVYLFDNKFDENPTDNLIVGSSGMRNLTFMGKSKGTATISFVYERSWEENAEDETIVYNVTVE